MKKNASEQTSLNSLQQTFWRWLSFSVLALAMAAAWPARSADVFIDEGDGDFAPTPLSSPASTAATEPVVAAEPMKAGPAPASEDSPIASPGEELDSQIGQLEPAAPSESDPMAVPADPQPMDPVVEAPVAKPKMTTAKKASKKKEAKTASAKASKKKSMAKKSKTKKKEKKTVKKKTKKKTVTSTKPNSKRKVASVTKFAGGQYATTSRDCTMESAPGAGDTVGTSKAARKLWVEESGNTSYYKVYGKSGSAAYLSRDCF
jgi:outer membrane biosynthesis protein TonB